MRLIDADALERTFFKEIEDAFQMAGMPKRTNVEAIVGGWTRGSIRSAPTIDAVPVVHGEWVKGEDDGLNTCSACKEYAEYTTRFCCNCGAKMDGAK